MPPYSSFKMNYSWFDLSTSVWYWPITDRITVETYSPRFTCFQSRMRPIRTQFNEQSWASMWRKQRHSLIKEKLKLLWGSLKHISIWLTDWLIDWKSSIDSLSWKNNLMHFTRKKIFPTPVWNLFMFPFVCISARVASTCWPCWTSTQQGRQSCLPFWSKLSECRGFMVRDSRSSLFLSSCFFTPAWLETLNQHQRACSPSQHGLTSTQLELLLVFYQPGAHVDQDVKSHWLSQSQKDMKLILLTHHPWGSGGQLWYRVQKTLGNRTPFSPTLNADCHAGRQWVPMGPF